MTVVLFICGYIAFTVINAEIVLQEKVILCIGN